MKWTKRFAVILAAVCCLCGCTKSTIISPEAPSDVELAGEDGIVWGQLWEDFQDKYDDSDAYPVIIPKSAEIHIQKTAPGPPAFKAVATPTIFPVPMVAASAVHAV
jgi:hypothetical protein